ncbi:MAG: hypothetical protein IBJ09_07920 [Bacteroidia bacterium]|nr:hypothetical protein [Bacteroidia bacterium]
MIHTRQLGYKQFELSNHTGNILMVVSDRKNAVDIGTWVAGSTSYNTASFDRKLDYYVADVVEVTDYYPGGMPMPGRSIVDTKFSTYAAGHNGHFNDDEIYGKGNTQMAEFWEYDARLMRRWNTDPLAHAGQSRYEVFFSNPIAFADPLGLKPERPRKKDMSKEPEKPGDSSISTEEDYSSPTENPKENFIELFAKRRDGTSKQKGGSDASINVLIIIDSPCYIDEVSNYSHPNAKEPQNWQVVYATDISDAKKQLDQLYGNQKSINNLIIRSHGGQGHSGGLSIGTTPREGTDTPGTIEASDIYGYFTNKDSPEVLEYMDPNVIRNVKDLGEVRNYVKDDGNIIFSGCYSGSNDFGKTFLTYYMWENINVYFNLGLGGVLFEGPPAYLNISSPEGKSLSSNASNNILSFAYYKTGPLLNGSVNITQSFETGQIFIFDSSASPLKINSK